MRTVTSPVPEDAVSLNNVTELPPEMQFNESHVLQISCYSFIMVLSLIGNLCVLKAILRGPKRRRKSRVNLMLLHLAIADLFVTLIMIPEEIGWAATVQWVAGDFLCRLFSFFRIFGHYLSSFILVCISIDRYFAVVHPLSLNAAARRGKLMITTAWLLAISCSAPQMVIFHVMTHPTHTHYEQCVTFNFFPSQQHEIVYNLFCLTMLYMAPLLMIILSYGAIVVTIVQKTRLSADDSTIRRSSLGYLGKAKARTIKMTISIVAAFVVCWTPYVVISLWFVFDRLAAQRLDQRVQKALFIFACTNSCVNPLVYGIFNFCQKRKPQPQLTWRSSTVHSHANTSVNPTPGRSVRYNNSTESSRQQNSVVQSFGPGTPTVYRELRNQKRNRKYEDNPIEEVQIITTEIEDKTSICEIESGLIQRMKKERADSNSSTVNVSEVITLDVTGLQNEKEYEDHAL